MGRELMQHILRGVSVTLLRQHIFQGVCQLEMRDELMQY